MEIPQEPHAQRRKRCQAEGNLSLGKRFHTLLTGGWAALQGEKEARRMVANDGQDYTLTRNA